MICFSPLLFFVGDAILSSGKVMRKSSFQFLHFHLKCCMKDHLCVVVGIFLMKSEAAYNKVFVASFYVQKLFLNVAYIGLSCLDSVC